MTNRPLSVTLNLIFILVNALIWLVFGIIIAVQAHPALPDEPLIKGVMVFLSFVITGVLAVFYYLLQKRYRMAYYFALAFFIFVSLVTILDDFGMSDLVIFIINLIPIGLLLKDRAWYLQMKPQPAGSR